jgi:hypothetical protein
MELLILVAVLAFLGFAAQTWGADSRILDLDPTHPASVGIS